MTGARVTAPARPGSGSPSLVENDASATRAAVGPRSVAVALAVPLALYVVALVIRLWAIQGVPTPPNEGSAYYVGVARNLVEGRGLVSDAIWSYATPPLELPKPAFELWLPMATFVAAIPMALIGTGVSSAQLGMAVLGAAVAPLTWLIARDAARRSGLDAGRARTVALGAGLLAAVCGPFLVAAMAPDSTTPFLVFALAACALMPAALERAARPGDGAARALAPGAALGVALGLAYLSRQEAVYLGLAYLVLLAGSFRTVPGPARLARLARALLATAVGGAAVVVPWLLRNLATFGSLWPGQALENAWFTANEQVFAYAERPTASAFLEGGATAIVTRQVHALQSNLVDVLVVQAAPLGLVGLIALLLLRRSPAVRQPSPLKALVVSGVLTYLVTSLVFPVATLWGTFLHASGPLVVALLVLGVLGADRLVARIARLRSWGRSNAWLAPGALLALTVPLALLQVMLVKAQSQALETRLAAVRDVLAVQPEVTGVPPRPSVAARRAVLVSDHPVWLAEALRRPVAALPDEPPAAVWRLARDFSAPLVLVLDDRGRYPEALASADARGCFERRPVSVPAAGEIHLYGVATDCGAP